MALMPEPENASAIRIENLHKSYGTTRAVDGVSLTVHAGEVMALLGPNGAGKSTTIDMLLGLSKADEGTVALFGRTPAEAVAAGLVGAMLQTGRPIQNTTVRQLLTVMASLYPHPSNVDDVLELTGLTDIADKQASKLSGGQTQRVRFALALVSDPALLVLDEPTAALDVEGRHAFWQSMRGLAASGRTIVFATHYLEEADQFADRIVLMANGKLVADGSATQIKSVVDVRTIRATLPGSSPDGLSTLSGVRSAERRGHSIVLSCHDSDTALRELLQRYPEAHDIEVHTGGLDEAFRRLTSSVEEDRT